MKAAPSLFLCDFYILFVCSETAPHLPAYSNLYDLSAILLFFR